MAKIKNNRFDIDFFEFSVLVEACIPKRPIMRTMFFHKVIDEFYYVLTQDERNKLFEWINRNSSFDLKEEDCQLFYDRYNPDNQYKVKTLFKGKEDVVECFKYKDSYHTSRTTSIQEEFITEITKI